MDSHLAQGTPLAARAKQRIHQSFETIQQVKSRLEETPPQNDHISLEKSRET